MTTKVKQLNFDCYGCKGDLNNPKNLVNAMRKGAKAAGAKPIGYGVKNYPIHGLTAIVFLAESHIVVSTYPEHRYAVVEIFMCNDKMNPDDCWSSLKKYVKPKKTVKNEFYHDIGRYPI